jgi:uncharacterized membrane protein
VTNKVKLAFSIALTCYAGLLVLLVGWIVWWVPPTLISVNFALLLALTPLLIPLKGIVFGDLYTYSWAPFFMLLYFIHGVSEAYSVPAERLYACLEIFFSSSFFVASAYYVKLCKLQQIAGSTP